MALSTQLRLYRTNLYLAELHNTFTSSVFKNIINGTITQPFYGPFFREHPGELVPEENFWTLWCKGRLTEADTPTIRLGATPSGLTSAHLHHPPNFLQAGCPSCRPTMSKHWRHSTKGSMRYDTITYIKNEDKFYILSVYVLLSNVLQLLHSGRIPYDAPVEVAIIRISPRRLLCTQNQNDWVIWWYVEPFYQLS